MKLNLNKPNISYIIKNYWMFLLSLFLIVIDQITKFIAERNLNITPIREVAAIYQQYREQGLDTNALYFPAKVITNIPNLFYWRLVYNDGAAWSIFSGSSWFLITISVISSIGLIIAVIYFVKKSSQMLAIILSVILAGAIGNGIDRVMYQGIVIDFIDFNFFLPFNSYFPIFNFADMCVSVGGFLLIIFVIYSDIITSKQSNKHADGEK